jgi:predicted small secreted protein
MRMKIIAAALVATGVLAACDTNEGPVEEAGESIDEAIDNIDQPDTIGESHRRSRQTRRLTPSEDAADDVDGAIDETGDAMEEAADPPQ